MQGNWAIYYADVFIQQITLGVYFYKFLLCIMLPRTMPLVFLENLILLKAVTFLEPSGLQGVVALTACWSYVTEATIQSSQLGLY